jgi:hypothetical protein
MQQPHDLPPFQAKYFTPEMTLWALKVFSAIGPIVALVAVLFSSAVIHLFLMLAAGANKPYHTTLRVFCFSYGSAELLQILPFCGGPLAMVWLTVCCVVGLTVAHGTTTGRSVAAMVLFLAGTFVCCMGFFAMAQG